MNYHTQTKEKNQHAEGKIFRCADFLVFLLYSIFRMALAGTPAATAFAGTSFVTTAPAAITALSPIMTPGSTVAFAPIQTFFPIRIGAGNKSCRSSGAILWLRVASTTLWPISAPSPMEIPP